MLADAGIQVALAMGGGSPMPRSRTRTRPAAADPARAGRGKKKRPLPREHAADAAARPARPDARPSVGSQPQTRNSMRGGTSRGRR
jgi:hypothetical protein